MSIINLSKGHFVNIDMCVYAHYWLQASQDIQMFDSKGDKLKAIVGFWRYDTTQSKRMNSIDKRQDEK